VLVKSVAVNDLSKQLYETNIKQQKNINFSYLYAVAAVDAAGNVSPRSSYVSIRLADNKAPKSPILVTAKQQDKVIVLNWRANTEDDLKGYKVYRLDQLLNEWIQLNESLITRTEFIDDSVLSLSDYRYQVRAVDEFANESKATKGIPVRTTSIQRYLETPQHVVLSVTKRGLPLLTWQVSDANTKSSVFRSDGGSYKMFSPLQTDMTFIDSTIQQGKAYNYVVKTVSSIGEFSAASQSVLWTGSE